MRRIIGWIVPVIVTILLGLGSYSLWPSAGVPSGGSEEYSTLKTILGAALTLGGAAIVIGLVVMVYSLIRSAMVRPSGAPALPARNWRWWALWIGGVFGTIAVIALLITGVVLLFEQKSTPSTAVASIAQPAPPQQAGLCPPGEVRLSVGAPCTPKGTAAVAPTATPAAPAAPSYGRPAVAPDVASIKMPRTVCQRKETLSNFPLTKDGITVVFHNPTKCVFRFDVNSGMARVTFADGSPAEEYGPTTCAGAAANTPKCRPRHIATITSATPSSAITLTVEPK